MCGICGVLNLNSEVVDPKAIEKMAKTLQHRGPDESGVYAKGRIGFGHRRLSIIDVSSGQQPMSAADSQLWITFNGEVFNYVELRKDLEKCGHRFRTQSDTEVILHLYQEHGEECVQYMNGQWAFAIWDEKKEKLFLSRDRTGVRPLFYTLSGQSFVFGSEVKAIFAHPSVRREIDLIGLDQIFTFWCTIAPRSIFTNIQELPAGYSLSVESRSVRSWPYWQLEYPVSFECRPEEDWAAELMELLMDATRIRLRSDVPVGAYLSGGLDSTIVTAIIKRHTDAKLKSFSVVFEDPQFDERKYQREAVAFLGTEHHEAGIAEEDIARVFPDVIWHTEKPILRSAPAPMYLLSSLVRSQGYKVVLSGEGADEVLGGYDIFKESKIRRFCSRRRDSKWRALLLRKLYPYMQGLQSQPDAYLRAFFHVGQADAANPFFSHLPRWELTARLKTFLSNEVRETLVKYNALQEMEDALPESFRGWDGLLQAQYLEARYLLPGYILSSQGDRMAMAHSVEGRFPFLDYRVVELARTMPPNVKMKVLNEKYILKLAAKQLVPNTIKTRKKQPYRAPDGSSFFTEGRARESYVQELLAPSQIRKTGLFNCIAVGKLCDKIKTNKVLGAKDDMSLIGILSTQLLVSQFLERT